MGREQTGPSNFSPPHLFDFFALAPFFAQPGFRSRKNSFAWPGFRSAPTGALASQARGQLSADSSSTETVTLLFK